MLIEPLAELGLVAFDGPNDPAPSLVLDGDRVIELDGRTEAEWDVLDHFVARYGIDAEAARGAAALDDAEIARRLVDVDVSRAELVRISGGLSPARLARIVATLDPVELMFALKKLRSRRFPANQAHVTNLKENPALLAADAAEAAARGFAEVETTVGVSRYAALNALAVLVGAQTGRPGVMTQCAVEERLNLRLAIQGLVTYAETLSVYGTEPVFVDGDDTPWSKALLASAYASRGVKVRFTSGGGSEALMGESEGKSLLYLEARCLAVVRAAGSQGVQNGSISCIALALSLPGGTREVLAENVLAAWLDLEVASGNDAIASHSEIRKTAKLMGQFLPGTDFVTSGYSSMPRYDNMFGGGNYDSQDYDEWLTIQRDWQVDAGIEPLSEQDAVAVRTRGARAVQAVFADLRFPPVTDEEVELAATCLDSRDLPDRDRAADVLAGDRVLAEAISGLDVARILSRHGFDDVATAVFDMQRQRVAADYLQTAAVIQPDGTVASAVNEPNDYRGPGTGYRLEGARWERLRRLPHAIDARLLGAAAASEPQLRELGDGAGARRAGRRRGGGRPRVRGRARGDDQRPRSRRCAGSDPRRDPRGRRLATSRARSPLGGRRVHRARRCASRGVSNRGGPAVEGDGTDPPRRSAAARQSRAVRNGAATDARFVPADRRQRRRLCARPPGRPGADDARQLRAREADRADNAAARPRGGGSRPRRAAGRGRARARTGVRHHWCLTPIEPRYASSQGLPLRPQRWAS